MGLNVGCGVASGSLAVLMVSVPASVTEGQMEGFGKIMA